MAAEKKIGHGILLKQGSTTLTQIRNIRWAPSTREDVDATTLEDSVEYMLPSDPEAIGEITAEQVWTSGETNHELLDTSFGARSLDAYSIVFNTYTVSRTATFTAWVKSLGDIQIDGKTVLSRTIVLKPTTTVTWT